MICVTNKYHDPNIKGEYVGRPSTLGNPFVIGKDGDRLEVITKYRRWLWKEMQHQGSVYRKLLDLKQQAIIGDLNLICYCHPKPCHADVIKNCLAWLIQEDRQVAPPTD